MASIEKLEYLLREGKISRRKFITQVSAFGLMAAVSPSLLSGRAMAATPKREAGLYRDWPPAAPQIHWIVQHFRIMESSSSTGNCATTWLRSITRMSQFRSWPKAGGDPRCHPVAVSVAQGCRIPQWENTGG